MSPSASDSGEFPAVMSGDGQLERPAGGAAAGTATGVGPPRRDVAAPRARAVRSPGELDYRLRGLSADPTDYIPTAPTRPDRRRRRPRRNGPLLARLGAFLVVAVLAAWLLQAFAVQPFSVPGVAMTPTLQAGDRILAVKAGPLAGPVHAGQIIVFRSPQFLPCAVRGSGADLVLRVVALPGQAIWSIGNTIFVNGRPLREPGWFNRRYGPVGSRPIPSTKLSRDHYYVLGDNRAAACDSRVFGPVPKSSIIGEGIAIVARQGHMFLHKL